MTAHEYIVQYDESWKVGNKPCISIVKTGDGRIWDSKHGFDFELPKMATLNEAIDVLIESVIKTGRGAIEFFDGREWQLPKEAMHV